VGGGRERADLASERGQVPAAARRKRIAIDLGEYSARWEGRGGLQTSAMQVVEAALITRDEGKGKA